MLQTFDGLGTAALEIEIPPQSPVTQTPACRLVFESGHIERIVIEPRFARMLRRLATTLRNDVGSVSAELQGFRMKETIVNEMTRDRCAVDASTVDKYVKAIRKAVKQAFYRAQRHDASVEIIDPIEISRSYGVRLNGIAVRVIDHSSSPTS